MRPGALFLVKDEVILAAGNHLTGVIDLRGLVVLGVFSIYLTLTGTGTAKVEYLGSHNGSDFLTPSGATEIVTGFTVGSDLIHFEPEVTPYMKLKITEDGEADPITVSLSLAFH